MLRLSGLFAALAVLGLAGAVSVMASDRALSERRAAAAVELGRAERLLGRDARLKATDLVNVATALGNDPELAGALGGGDLAARRAAAFRWIEKTSEALTAKGQGGDLMMVTDSQGLVLARNLDALAFGEDLKAREPAVASALAGTASADLWLSERHLVRIGVAPIGRPAVGSVVLGRVVSSADAREEARLLGVDVAYLLAGKVEVSSVDAAVAVALLGELPDGVRNAPLKAATAPAEIALRGIAHSYLAAPLPFGEHHRAVIVLVADLSSARISSETLTQLVWLLGVAGALGAALAALGVARHYRGGIRAIEANLERIASGELDATIEVPARAFETLCDEIENARSRLLGDREPATAADEWWNELLFLGDDNTGAMRLAAEERAGSAAAAISLESEEAYFLRTFEEFLAARNEVGAPIEGVSLAQFIDKVREQERSLCERYGAQAIRFKVETRGTQVVLRPVSVI